MHSRDSEVMGSMSFDAHPFKKSQVNEEDGRTRVFYSEDPMILSSLGKRSVGKSSPK